ncbi:MAG: TonB-dependent hemoglobin/transferrin/lactoferrin family receptor [Afipia sp.]|nr:TonB-dependent hemoglobin/transferrin/lactoferrin family receptor [Afipia sp.]
MSGLNARACALLLSVSVAALGGVAVVTSAHAQPAEISQPVKPKQIKRKRTGKPMAEVPLPKNVANANAQVGTPVYQSLDEITVGATKLEERAIDSLAPVSVVTLEQIQGRNASTVGDLVYNMPGVWLQNRGDEPSTSINIRGLQDFGRVAVVVDGARQNYQRTGHFANGSFFLNPELIGGIDIVRGPTANIYGSGAIGGVASFRTKDIQDVVRPGERWGVDTNTVFGTNNARALQSVFAGVRVNPNVDVFAGGSYSTQNNFKDGTGYEVANTWNRLSSGIGKLTVRPADGHEVKLGMIFQENLYNVGQTRRNAGDPNVLNGLGGTSIYGTDVKNYTATLGWTYQKPEDKLFDWDAKIYWNRTENDQIKLAHTSSLNSAYCGNVAPGNPVSGCVGSTRSYTIDTYGFDVHNTTRVETGDWRHALTYGFDGFQDQVSTWDSSGNSNATTPPGTRTVWGGFFQYKANYSSLLEVVSAVRYDNYELKSVAGGASGDRFSPKITVGLLPAAVMTPYVSYAEGYRAPSITETLVTGTHAAASTFDAIFLCAGSPPGVYSSFCFLPNTSLRPEVGKNKEIGLNIKKNDLFKTGDSFRGKFNVFRNDVDNYIDLVASAPQPIDNIALIGFYPGGSNKFYQYQNIAAARIQGFEAETMYDAGLWFLGVSATIQEGKNVQTGIGLYSIAPQKFTTTAGVRLFDNQALFSVMWTSVKGNTDIPANYLPGTSYDLVNMYLTVKPTPNLTLVGSVENLLNQYYRPYAVPRGSANDTQNDVLWASVGAGITFKGAIKYHFGGT